MNFINRDTWTKIERSVIRKLARKPVPVKWIFKVKEEHHGGIRYKSSVVVKGYMQIPGVDFTESFSPVATDTSIWMMIEIFLFYEKGKLWILEMFDVEAAFLNADLDRPMYVEWPEGMVELGFMTQEEVEKYCIQLDRAMYGNVDAPIRWMRTFSKHPKSIGMIQSKTDPCIFYKLDEKGELEIMMAVHVDDTVITGTRKSVDWCYKKIQEKFKIDLLGIIKKHLGVWWT